MKNIVIVIIVFINFLAPTKAQTYFSDLIETADNPLAKEVFKNGSSYIIGLDLFGFEGVHGGYYLVSEESLEADHTFYTIDLGPYSYVGDGVMYYSGEDPQTEGDSMVLIGALDLSTNEEIWSAEYSLDVNRTFNAAFTKIDGYLYSLNVNDLDPPSTIPRDFTLLKTNLFGDLKWSRRLNENKRLCNAFEMISLQDSKLLISSTVNYYNIGGRYSQLIKLSPEGEVLWNYEGTEKLDNGAVPTWATELSDSSIVQTYYVDRKNDLDFIANEWFKTPNKLVWFSEDGELIKQKYIITNKTLRLRYTGLETGKGEYFYAFGYAEDLILNMDDQFYAHLTKFNNNGDTIWSRNYQHSDFPKGDVNFNIKDIYEEENGDIIVLCEIQRANFINEIWLFKVNSEGCYINEKCEDMRDLTMTTDKLINEYQVYPNPVAGMLNIMSSSKIINVSVLDLSGQLLLSKQNIDHNHSIDLSTFPKGMYLIKSIDENNAVVFTKIIKV